MLTAPYRLSKVSHETLSVDQATDWLQLSISRTPHPPSPTAPPLSQRLAPQIVSRHMRQPLQEDTRDPRPLYQKLSSSLDDVSSK